jgi:hypothetical protein
LKFGQHFVAEKKARETADEFEKRTAYLRAPYDTEECVHPKEGRALYKCIIKGAQFTGEKVAGRGAQTWAKLIESGVMVTDGDVARLVRPVIESATGDPSSVGGKPYTMKDVQGGLIVWHFVPANGKPGGGSRVMRGFPTFPDWRLQFLITVMNDSIKPEAIHRYLAFGGLFDGIGMWRPGTKGTNGRFWVSEFNGVKQEQKNNPAM